MKPKARITVTRQDVLSENDVQSSVINVGVSYEGFCSGMVVLNSVEDLVKLRDTIDAFVKLENTD